MHINIDNLMRQRGISKYGMAKLLNISYPTMSALYSGNITSIKLDILEKLCIILGCTPSEILLFDSKNKSPYLYTDDITIDYMNPPE